MKLGGMVQRFVKKHVRPTVASGIVAIVLLPMIVTSSSSPSPGNCFRLSGFVVRSSGGSVANYTVVLVGRGGNVGLGEEWERLDSNCGRDEYFTFDGNIAITITNGRYFLQPCSCQLPDSIAAAVLLPDTMILSQPIARRSLSVYEAHTSYSYAEDGFMCDNTITDSYLSNYVYGGVDSVIIPVP